MVYLNVTTSPANALQVVNNLTIVEGIPLLSTTILVFIWFIVYYRSKERNPWGSVSVASFFTCIIGFMLAFLGLVPDVMVGVLIAVSVLSIIPLINR